jgi:hypothetical protein
VSAPPLIPSALYGLRAWRVVPGPEGERLAGPQLGADWPPDGAWLHARCDRGHPAPDPDCDCGIHAWHPSARAARTVLATRRHVAGVVEATGAIELHEDGFRTARARPYALVARAGGNVALVERLAAAYGAHVIPAKRPGDVLAWCRERGLGLSEAAVADLLELPPEAERRRRRRREQRVAVLRVAAAVAIAAALVAAGTQFLHDPPGPRVLNGRAGEVHVP